MVRDTLLLLVMLNPFATMLYLSDLMQERPAREFLAIYNKASVFTLLILYAFALTGDFVLDTLFQVSLPAVQIFGGMTIGMAAFTYIMQGPEGIKLFKGDIATIAQHIALPFLVGPGAIWVSISIGRSYPAWVSLLMIVAALAISGAAVLIYLALIKRASGHEVMTRLLSYFQMAMRLNALLIGAVAVQMILSGIESFLAQ